MTVPSTDLRPYIGLRYFEERDAHLFYGRDEHTADLLAKLAGNRFVAVMGSSGCGKSSLVRAGLLPELRSGMIPNAGPTWNVVEFKPGTRPLGALSDAIQTELGVPHAHELVQEGPLGIARAVASANLPPGTNILVIADQFEEVFRFQREESNQGRGAEALEQCRALVRRLLDAATQSEWPIYVLLVMRSDYLGECSQFPELPERMSESLYLVPRLRRDQLEEAITAPVGGAVELSVVQRLLSEVGSDPDQLPRLQHLLGRMWEQAKGGWVTMDHYTEVGGWDNGLQKHLEEIYDHLTDSQKLVCQRVFQQLSELDKGRAVRRRAAIEDVTQVCGPETGTVVGKFRDRGFLLPQLHPVDITHECVLRAWTRCRDWVTEEEKARAFYRELVVRKDRPGRLHGSDLREVSRQRQAGRFTEQWALRYGTRDDLKGVEHYVNSSRRVRQAAQFGMGALALILIFLGAYTVWSSRQQELRARARMLAAYAAMSLSEDPALALYLGVRAAQTAQPLLPGLESFLADTLRKGHSFAALRGHADAVVGVAWSPDGKSLASASADHTIRLWDPATGQTIRTLTGHEGSVSSVAWSPSGNTLASASEDGTIRLWDPATGQTIRTLTGHEGSVSSVAWSPSGNTLASASEDGTIRLWDPATGKAPRTLISHEYSVRKVAWSPDGRFLASADSLRGIVLRNPDTGRNLRTLSCNYLVDFAWSPDGETLACLGFFGTLKLLSLKTGESLGDPTTPFDSGTGQFAKLIAWSPNGEMLALSDGSGTIQLRDPTTRLVHRTLVGHRNRVLSLAWSPDGKILAYANFGGEIGLWDTASQQSLRTFGGQGSISESVAWSPDGRSLASASGGETIRLWNPANGQTLCTLTNDQDEVKVVAWSPDGKTLAALSTSAFEFSDTVIRLLDIATGDTLRTLAAPQFSMSFVFDVAWSPDGKTLASAGNDKTIRLWDPATGQTIRTLTEHQKAVISVAWSPDGKTLASASEDHTIRLWDPATGQTIRTLTGHEGSVSSVAWSPSGNTLASASEDGTSRLWGPATGQTIRTLTGHEGSVLSVAWSPDGKTLASASQDKTVRLWDAAKGKDLRTLIGHEGSVSRVAWSPDGKTLASAGYDGTIRLWPGTVGGLLDQARHAIRLYSLSEQDCQRYFNSKSCPPIR